MVEWLPDRIGDYDPYNFFHTWAGPILLRCTSEFEIASSRLALGVRPFFVTGGALRSEQSEVLALSRGISSIAPFFFARARDGGLAAFPLESATPRLCKVDTLFAPAEQPKGCFRF